MNLFKKTAFTRTLFFVAADIFFVALSVWLAFILRFDGKIPLQYFSSVYKMIILETIFTILVFYFYKLYSFSWAYVSTNELLSLLKSIAISFLFLEIIIFLSGFFIYLNFPSSTIFTSYIFIFIFCGGIRLSKRIYFEIVKLENFSNKKKTLIVGAGDAAEQIVRSIVSSKKNFYNPVGFVDDNPIKKGILIHGLKVLGKISDIPQIAEKYKVKQLIIALPSVNGKIIKEAVELGKGANIKKIKIAPPISEIIRGQVAFNNLRDVSVEDLLGRDQVILEMKEIENFIKDKSVLITGAAGSIGSELSRQVSKFEPKIIFLLDQDETGIFNISKELIADFPDLKMMHIIADITDKQKIKAIFKKFKPQIIFHAAAYKHVPLMEENPDEAVKNNIFGTKNVAEAALEFSEKFVFISTDKAVNPTSVMGATKRAGEMICQNLNTKNKTKFISVRFGNVLNSRGSVIPIFREQIKKGGPVEITHPDMKRYFMLTSEACLLVMQAGAMGKGGEVFVLDMGEPVKILDLAKEMIKLSGLVLDKDIAIVFVGKRPGEKLFEEMLTVEEGTFSTQNKKIFMAKVDCVNSENFIKKVDKLNEIIMTNKIEEIKNYLKEIIPLFKQG